MRRAARIAAAEAAGTFGLVAAATGSIAVDGRAGYWLGAPFIAAMHFAGLAVVVWAFGRYSMAHFNPAVTAAFVATGHLRARMAPLYVGAQAAGAVLGSLLVLHAVGDYAGIGANSPGAQYGAGAHFAAEVLATALLMCVVLAAVSMRRIGARAAAAAIGGVVALDVLAFGGVSGASMNPIRSLAPAIVSGDPSHMGHMWLYASAPLAGALGVAAAYRWRFSSRVRRRI